MADRFLFKKFASETNDVGQFGSFQATGGNIGDGVKTTDPNLIQSLPAWKAGWGNAVDNGLLLPRLEEMNGVQRVFAEMLWNQWRDGVTFWQAGAPVKALQSIVMYQTGDELPKLYINKTCVNGTNPPPQDTDNWTLAFDPTNIQLISNMEQTISDAADKYPSSKAIKDYTSNFDVSSTNFTSHVSKFPVNYSMTLSVENYNQYKPNLFDNSEAIYPIGKNSTLVVGSTFTYGENTGTIKDITTDENGLSFAKIRWSTNNYYGEPVTEAAKFVLLKDGGQLVSLDFGEIGALVYAENTPSKNSFYGDLIYWYDATNNLMKKSVDKGETWTDCYASFPLASFGTKKDNLGNISVTECHFCYSVSFMDTTLICLPFGEITGVFGTSSFNREVKKVPTLFETGGYAASSIYAADRNYFGVKLSRTGAVSNRVYRMTDLEMIIGFTNYGFSTGAQAFNLQTNSLVQNGEAGSTPLDFCPMGIVYATNNSNQFITGVDCFQSTLNAPMQPIIQETYRVGTSWYRIWSDGWIEQGGIVQGGGTLSLTGNLLVEFEDTNYTILVSGLTDLSQQVPAVGIQKTTKTFGYYWGIAKNNIQWFACGY